MALELSLEEDEELVFEGNFYFDKHTEPFAFAVSNRAIFVKNEKHFAKESWYFEKIPHKQVKQVFLHRERPLFVWALASLTFIFGLILSILMMATALSNEPGPKTVSGIPFGLTVCGLLMPFLAKGRKILVVEYLNGIYKWKPRLVIDKQSKKRIQNLQENILTACQKVGIYVWKEEGK